MSLKKKVILGIKWNSALAVFTSIMAIAKTAIMARLLSPTEFGLMAMIEGIIVFGNPLADMGIGAAIIQKSKVTVKQLSTLYWLNILLGIFVYVVMVSISPFIADFYNEEVLEDLLILLALTFLISPAGAQFNILFQKNLNFGVPAKIDFIANIISFVISVALAYHNWGVLSLIYGRLARVTFSTLFLISFGLKMHKPKLYFNLREVKSIVGFGSFQMGERYAQILSGNWDKILIGKLLGAEILGFYNIAYTFIVMPVQIINPIVTKVAFPVFSMVKENQEKMNSYYYKALSMLMTINFPVYIGIVLVAPELVQILFGEQWLPSVVILQILAFEVLFRSIGNPGGSVIKARGRADIGFYWSIVRSIAVLISIFIAYYISNTVISIAIGILICRYTIGIYWHFIIMKIGKINYNPIIKSAFKTLILTAIMALSVIIFNYMFKFENIILKFTIDISIGAIVYSLLILKFDKNSKNLVTDLFK